MSKNLKDLVYELDNFFGLLMSKKESINAIKIELGRVREGVDNTNQLDMTAMAMQFRDMCHSIILLDDLLYYLVKDFDDNIERGYDIKSELFQKIVRERVHEQGHAHPRFESKSELGEYLEQQKA
ncbi:hypothetical protein GN156_04080 [bacterium LRH843]|nr:hypothetical protein [bacterium LRH843]